MTKLPVPASKDGHTWDIDSSRLRTMGHGLGDPRQCCGQTRQRGVRAGSRDLSVVLEAVITTYHSGGSLIPRLTDKDPWRQSPLLPWRHRSPAGLSPVLTPVVTGVSAQ